MLRSCLDSLGIRRSPDAKTVAVSMRPKRSPWGGGNQFVEQLINHLKASGHRVTFRLRDDVTSILLVDPRPIETTAFSMEAIESFKRTHPGTRCVHRINECDQRKGTSNMDDLLHEANSVADVTVFISEWLRDYFVDRWFDPQRPHAVIQNGADPEIYHPSSESFAGRGLFKIVTHHWSDNWNKGFGLYKEVDEMIHRNELEHCSLMVIGRWPKGLRWTSARTHPPVRGKKLANLLRQNHVYLTASLWEPCGMHHIEGAQCGLPLLYHEDGGGIVEFGKLYGIGFRDDIKGALNRMRNDYALYREKALKLAPSGHRMCREYEKILIQ